MSGFGLDVIHTLEQVCIVDFDATVHYHFKPGVTCLLRRFLVHYF